MNNYSGKGYMSRGLKLVLKNIFEEIKLHRIEANIQPKNTPSINLVKANGFSKEGYSPKYLNIDGKWGDHERWALTYEDFERANKNIELNLALQDFKKTLIALNYNL